MHRVSNVRFVVVGVGKEREGGGRVFGPRSVLHFFGGSYANCIGYIVGQKFLTKIGLGAPLDVMCNYID
jgi:hypothetical protein